MKVCVLGLWHLGAVIAACLSAAGHEVVAVDDDRLVVNEMLNGILRVAEPGLADAVLQGIKSGHLNFTDDYASISDADVVWIAFDTPVDENDRADVAVVEQWIKGVIPCMGRGASLFISSQVPVGFSARLEEFARDEHGDKAISVAYLPENLRLGKALQCFTRPDRIIVGSRCEKALERASELLSPFCHNLIFMSLESAEMTKHAINAFFGLSVAFINEVASICEVVGADAKDVERGLKSEERIGPKAYLSPGGAFAGGTLARDLVFLKELGEQNGCPTTLLSSVPESNEAHKTWARRRLAGKLDRLAGQVIAVLGLTYKPGTDTLRRSSAVELCRWLVEQGSVVQVHDPAVKSLPSSLAESVSLHNSAKEAIKGSRAMVLATEWPEYREISAGDVLALMTNPLVLDANGFLRPNLENESGIEYIAVGKPV